MTLHIVHVLHVIYNDFTLTLHKILHEDYILSCNYSVITAYYMKKSVPPIFVNGGYRLFYVIIMHLPSFYTQTAKFYIQDVIDTKDKISKFHDYMNFTSVYIELNLLHGVFIYFMYKHGVM